MKNIVLLVQSEEQASQLVAAGRVIGKLAPIGLWVLYSPIITIDTKDATKEIDAEIEVLVAEEKSAAERGDYESAKQHRSKRDGLMTDRSVSIRNAWKRVSPEDRKKGADKHLRPFLEAANPKQERREGWRVSQLPEHQDAAHWIPALNELSAIWHKGMVPGDFAIMWPSQLVALESNLVERFVLTKQNSLVEALPRTPAAPQSRDAELKAMRFFSLAAVAKGLGIETKGKKSPVIVAEILAAEAQKKAA